MLSINFEIVSRFLALTSSIAEMCLPSCLDLFSAVGFLRQMRSRYLRYRLEAKVVGVIHRLGGFREIILETSGA